MAKEKKKTAKSESKDQVYNSKNYYSIGDEIYHKSYDDKGKVVEVGITSDGVKKMVVEFEKTGRKKLVMAMDE